VKSLNVNNNFRKESNRFKEKKGNSDNVGNNRLDPQGMVRAMEVAKLIQMEAVILDL
jgi:hypothetical protein